MPFVTRIDADNALEIIGQFDLVVDGSDNFATRYLVNDACYLAKKPLVFAAVGPFDGQLTLFKAYEKSVTGAPNPSYRCLFPTGLPSLAVCQAVRKSGCWGLWLGDGDAVRHGGFERAYWPGRYAGGSPDDL